MELKNANQKLTKKKFVQEIAKTLSKRKTLLRISAMNLYEIEEHSRMENLVEYKHVFKLSLDAFLECFQKYLPQQLSKEKLANIRYAFFPFMYGIYPYVYPTEKQKIAMKQESISVRKTSIEEIVENFLNMVLQLEEETNE